MRINAEFLIEPFSEGAPGPHVQRALSILESGGHTVELGPFGSSVSGSAKPILTGLAEAFSSALESGATRLTLTIEVDPT